MSDQKIVFKRSTLKLPYRAEVFRAGKQIGGYRVQRLLSVDVQKSVFLLDHSAVLCVRHNSRRISGDLLSILRSDRRGLVHVLDAGTIGEYWYTIDRKLETLPSWERLTEAQRLEYVKQMAYAVNSLHDTGYCHLDIKPEHFGIDQHGQIRLIDLDSAKPYTNIVQEAGQIEYSPQYAAPELFENRYSTASDLYSLGKSIADWSGIDTQRVYLDWRKIVRNLVRSDPGARYNYTQVIQAAEKQAVELNTGPRSYKNAILVGRKKAYSDRQMALYLTQDYTAAINYVSGSSDMQIQGNTSAEKVARLIHKLDPALPLWWYGKEYMSTKVIANAMSARFPQKDARFIELLRTGILLEFPQILRTDNALVALLRNAASNPGGRYWEISAAFGGKTIPKGTQTGRTVVSLTKVAEKRKVFNELIGRCLRYGDPVTVASTLESIRSYPGSGDIDSVIARLRAIPLDEHNENLTNIGSNEALGIYIETRLPDPGHRRDVTNINELFSGDTKYLIRKSRFEEWIRTNEAQRRMRSERNWSIAKALGWTALGIGFLAILPYILMALLIIGLFIIVISIL